MDDIEQLRELHDTYVWEVNAAAGEGRLDLVRQLADQYLDEALRLVTDGEPAGCGDHSVPSANGPARQARGRDDTNGIYAHVNAEGR